MSKHRGAPVQPDIDDPPPGAKPKRVRTGNADADAAMRLLEWARRKGFRIGPELTVGGVSMHVVDVRLVRREKLVGGIPGDDEDDDDEDDEATPGILAEHGGPAEEPAEGTAG
jgi:hypothetical protein